MGIKSDETVRFDELAVTVVGELAATGLTIELVESTPVLIRAAPLAITRVLRNVLTNASTHGKGCKVAIEARRDWAVVVIEDSGPGIPAEVIDRVFEPFFRIDPARQQVIRARVLDLQSPRRSLDAMVAKLF